ncbi:MAG TPA: conjugal transfer protein, partial [Porphyromonadaceae bacterium]|nr:conjugal transfer protein [Porphyromonadaceae bacterium]
MAKKKILSTAIVLIAAFNAFAQGNGAAGITKATDMVTGY